MAVRIARKLFPVATGTNQQIPNCSNCPYDCPFDCFDFPDFNFPPPPPFRDHQNQLQPVTIVLIALFVGFFFTFCFYILLVKCRAWGNESRDRREDRSDGGEGAFLHENQIDHPIWFITTVGLQQSVINSITVCKYKKREGLIEGTECSVCLSEFEEDEMIRLLPKCSHAFHVGCVDTWLRTHTTCPLCRAQILTDFASSNSVRPPNFGSVNQNEANLGGIEDTQMEINGGVLGANPIGDENRGDDVDEQREIGVQIGEIVPKEGIFESDEVERNESRRNNQMDSS